MRSIRDEIVQIDHVAVCADGGVQVGEIVVRILRGEVRERLLAGDELCAADIVQRGEALLDGDDVLSLHRFVDIGEDLVLVLELVDIVVDIHREQREGTHDEQAGDNDDDAAKDMKPWVKIPRKPSPIR